MRRFLPWLGLALAVPAVTSCGGDDGGSDFPVAATCNPLGTNHCMTPWPSSAFEVEDASTATGMRLAIPEGALPTNASGVAIDPAGWNLADGFSPSAPIVVSQPGGFSLDGLVGLHEIGASLEPGSPTVIVDMTTGERVAHFAELDAPAAAEPDRQALYLRPAQRLVSGHRYAVALTRAVKASDGSPMAISPGMQALLDGTPTDHPLLERQRARFADVVDALAAAGVARDDLALAWDYTVASDDFLWRDMRSARDQAVAALDATPQTVEVFTDDPVDDGSVIAHKIEGSFTAPLFLDHDGRYVDFTVIQRDADGAPALQGTFDVDFTAIIPACAYTAPAPVGILIYGHGLMGDAGEVGAGSVRAVAAENCLVVVGTDMRGMSGRDLGAVASALTNFNRADEVFEVLVQGLVNHVALVRAAQTTLATQVFVDDQGRSLVDPTKVYYYGLSQGAIFGTSVIAWDPVIRRGVVGAGGANYSLMLERSTDWPTYRNILLGAYPDTLDLVLLINLMQMRWDKTEGASIAHVVTEGAPLGSPSKQVLMQIAIGDDEVPNVAGHWQARTMGIPVLTPSVDMPWGLETAASPMASGSALVIMDGRTAESPVIPDTNVPAPETGGHYVTRDQPATWRQIGTFFDTGMIENECDGACVCPAACQ